MRGVEICRKVSSYNTMESEVRLWKQACWGPVQTSAGATTAPSRSYLKPKQWKEKNFYVLKITLFFVFCYFWDRRSILKTSAMGTSESKSLSELVIVSVCTCNCVWRAAYSFLLRSCEGFAFSLSESSLGRDYFILKWKNLLSPSGITGHTSWLALRNLAPKALVNLQKF